MTNRVLQRGFSGGEICPSLFGRGDLDQYKMGATKLENFICMPQGAIRSRSGMRYVGAALKSNKAVRLIPFRYSSTQTFILEFGDLTMRVISNGAYVMKDAGTIYQIATPYSAEDLFDLDYSQNADVITFTSIYYQPLELRRYGNTNWQFEAVKLTPSIYAPSNVTVTAIKANYLSDTESKDANKLTVKYVVTTVNADGYESTASSEASGTGNYYINGCSIRVSWNAVKGADHYRVYRYVAGIFGYIGQTSNTYLDDTGDNPDSAETPPRYKTVFTGGGSNITSISVVNGGSGYWFGWDSSHTYLPDYINLSAIPPIAIWSTYTDDNSTKYGAITVSAVTLVIQDDVNKKVLKTVSLPFGTVSGQAGGVLTTNTNAGKAVYLTNTGNTQAVQVGSISGSKSLSFYISVTATASKGTIAFVKLSSDLTANGESLSFADKTGSENLTKALTILSGNTNFNGTINSTLYNDTLGATTLEMLNCFGGNASATCNIPVTITSSSGTGASAYAISRGGVITSVILSDVGDDYEDASVTVSSNNNGVGSGASFSAVIKPSASADLPSAVTQYDQRRVFAGSSINPLKVWFTNAGYQDLMMYHLPTQDDDRIEITAVTSDADRIKHLVALESLLLFTGSSELRVYTQNSDSLTPSSVAVKAQSFIGSNNVQPIIVNNYVIYASARGGHVRALGYDYNQGGYVSGDISIKAIHLFDGHEITSLALTKAPVQCVWATSDNGELLCCTYMPEQQIVAWSHHTTVNGAFECVATCSEEKEDHVYAVVNRNGKRLIERLDNIMSEYDTSTNRRLDSYLDGTFSEAQSVVSGLEHLNGQTVSVWVDGVQQSDKVVSAGLVKLDKAGKDIAIGLPITSTYVSVPLIDSSAEAGSLGRTKNITELFLRVAHDGNVKTGNYPNGTLWTCNKSDIYMRPSDDNSYLVKVSLDGDWSYEGQIKVVHDDALPLEIQSIVCNTSMEDGN